MSRSGSAPKNQKGLQDAMRAIVDAGGTIVHEWPIEKVLEVGDHATGTTVLADLYNRMKDTPVETDLDDLWRKLGVQVNNGVVTVQRQSAAGKNPQGDHSAEEAR